MLLPNGKVETFSNVTWINNVPPKLTPMELTPRGMRQTNNVKLLEARTKRRSDAVVGEKAGAWPATHFCI